MRKRSISKYLMSFMSLVLVGLGSGETVNANAQNEEVFDTFDEFGMAISALNKSESEEQRDSGQSADSDNTSRFVMVKAEESNIDFSDCSPIDVIAGPDHYYYISFAGVDEASKAVKTLEAREDIVYAEMDYIETGAEIEEDADEKIMDYGSGGGSTYNSWGVEYTGLNLYANSFATTSSITVAVVDSGVDTNHSDLYSRITSKQKDYIDNDSNAMDEHGHGTSVAGIIADATYGLKVNIMPVRVLDANNEGYVSGVVSGIRYAADNGAKVINLSLGGSHNQSKEDAIAYAINKGCIVVVAAGNKGQDLGESKYCPGHISDCITVAAVDFNGKLYSNNNFGSAIDVVAPGVNVSACKLGGGYRDFTGTSAATPHVSAFAAMIKLKFPDYTLTQVTNHIRRWADDAGESGFDNYYGYGIMNAGDACGYAKVTYHILDGTPDIIDWPAHDASKKYTIPSTIPFRMKYSFSGWEKKDTVYKPGDAIVIGYNMKFTAKWVGGTLAISEGITCYTDLVNNMTTNDGTYYRFTPQTSGTYVIQSNGNVDTKLDVYNADATLLYSDDDGGVYRNFRKEIYLSAGTTYYMHVYQYAKRPVMFNFEIYRKSLPEYTINYHTYDGADYSYTTCTSITPSLLHDPKLKATSRQLGWSISDVGNTVSYQVGEAYKWATNIDLYAVWGEPILVSSAPYVKNVTFTDVYDYRNYRFIVPETGNYKFAASSNNSPYTVTYTVYDKGGTLVKSVTDVDVEFTLNLTAGQEYYVLMEHQFDARVEGMFRLEYTDAPYAFSPLKANISNEAYIESGRVGTYYSFTAPSAGTYVFYSTGNTDVCIDAYSSPSLSGVHSSDDDGGSGRNFMLYLDMAKDETRYLIMKGGVNSAEGKFEIFVKKQVTVTYDANGGTGAPNPYRGLFGDTYYFSTVVPTRTNYTFGGWYSAASGGTKYGSNVELANDITLYAHWKSNTLPFTDVKKGAWYYNSVKFVYDNGYMNGKSSTLFDTDTTMNRGQMVAILWNMEGKPKVTGTSPFADVTSRSTFYSPILWAASNKVVNGYADGTFGPKDELTRQQIAAILMNYARYKGIPITGQSTLSQFQDVDKISRSMLNAVKWAVGNNIISGRSGGTIIDPKGNASRVEVAAMIMKFCKNFNL